MADELAALRIDVQQLRERLKRVKRLLGAARANDQQRRVRDLVAAAETDDDVV